ncbi:MAG: phage tail protein [Faecalibacterium sp.]
MLSYERDGALYALDCDTYYLQTEWNGAENTLHLSLPMGHPQMLELAERTRLYESDSGQTWLISKYDRSRSGLTLEAELDLDELCVGVLAGWENQGAKGNWMTLGETVQDILNGTGWTLEDQSHRTDRRQMDPVYGTLLEGISQAVELWGNDLGVQYDNATRVVRLVSPGLHAPSGCYLTEDLNLLECPQVRGKAKRGEYYNRLYLFGAGGLRLPAPCYVERRAEGDPVVSACKTEESIEDAETLLFTAQAMVDEAAVIARSYTCRVADLERMRPTEYAHLRLNLYDSVILIDRDNASRQYQQIARMKRWPAYPEKNEVTLSTVPGTLSARAGTTYSLARRAAGDARNAAKTATDYIIEDESGTHFGTDPENSFQIGEDGLQFKGIRNKIDIKTFTDPSTGKYYTSYSEQSVDLDLSSYSSILLTFESNKGSTWFASGGGGGATSMVIPVNGKTYSMVYPWNTVHRRNVTVYPNRIVFGSGYERTSNYNLGIINSFDLETVWSDGWKTNSAVCIPREIYGFM